MILARGQLKRHQRAAATRTVEVLPAALQAVKAVGWPASIWQRLSRCHWYGRIPRTLSVNSRIPSLAFGVPTPTILTSPAIYRQLAIVEGNFTRSGQPKYPLNVVIKVPKSFRFCSATYGFRTAKRIFFVGD